MTISRCYVLNCSYWIMCFTVNNCMTIWGSTVLNTCAIVSDYYRQDRLFPYHFSFTALKDHLQVLKVIHFLFSCYQTLISYCLVKFTAFYLIECGLKQLLQYWYSMFTSFHYIQSTVYFYIILLLHSDWSKCNNSASIK